MKYDCYSSITFRVPGPTTAANVAAVALFLVMFTVVRTVT